MPPREDTTDQRAFVRDATPEEAAQIFVSPQGYETWIGVLDHNGQIEGHVCLTRQANGQVFGHDVKSESSDVHGANKLFRAVKRQLKAWGQTEVFIHAEPGSSKRMLDFWLKHGATPAFMIYKLVVK